MIPVSVSNGHTGGSHSRVPGLRGPRGVREDLRWLRGKAEDWVRTESSPVLLDSRTIRAPRPVSLFCNLQPADGCWKSDFLLVPACSDLATIRFVCRQKGPGQPGAGAERVNPSALLGRCLAKTSRRCSHPSGCGAERCGCGVCPRPLPCAELCCGFLSPGVVGSQACAAGGAGLGRGDAARFQAWALMRFNAKANDD